MKVLPFQIPKPNNNSLIYQLDQGEEFYPHLHQHREVQISAILEGEGNLFIGNKVTRYSPGDIFVIGSNLPHLFKSISNPGSNSKMETLFFQPDLIDEKTLQLPEFFEVKKLLTKTDSGIRIKSNIEALQNAIRETNTVSGIERFVYFYKILYLLTRAKTESLSSFKGQKQYSEDEGSRMSAVMNLALSEYHRKISLQEVSQLANMTPPAFCKYFKQRTRKTFFEFVIELRIEQATRLLQFNKALSIADIADQTGFSNLSNFNRKFKSLKGVTPSHFRNSI